MRRMPHDRGGWSGDSRTASGFSGAPRIAPRKRRGRTKTGAARGGAQTRIWRAKRAVYAAPNPSKINESIFIILGWPAGPPGGRGGDSGKQARQTANKPKDNQNRTQNNARPLARRAVLCARESKYNKYVFIFSL